MLFITPSQNIGKQIARAFDCVLPLVNYNQKMGNLHMNDHSFLAIFSQFSYLKWLLIDSQHPRPKWFTAPSLMHEHKERHKQQSPHRYTRPYQHHGCQVSRIGEKPEEFHLLGVN